MNNISPTIEYNKEKLKKNSGIEKYTEVKNLTSLNSIYELAEEGIS